MVVVVMVVGGGGVVVVVMVVMVLVMAGDFSELNPQRHVSHNSYLRNNLRRYDMHCTTAICPPKKALPVLDFLEICAAVIAQNTIEAAVSPPYTVEYWQASLS